MAAVQASRLPVFTRGAYLLLADDTMWVKNDQGQSVNSDSGNWNPKLSSWIHSFNVVFFAFINHEMQVPPSFENARTSGQFAPGTKIIYSIAGGAYSRNTAAWKKLFESESAAKQLAQTVSQWKSDGIDLDFEVGAGDDWTLAQNVIVFVKELRKLKPNFIITQAVFGFPQIYQQSLLTVKSWNAQGQSLNMLDSVGLMVYSKSESLQYVGQYTGSSCNGNWCGLCNNAKVITPCTSVPAGQILAGLDGGASQSDVNAVCQYLASGKAVGGFMIWYASADNGFVYGGNGDGRFNKVNWMCSQHNHEAHHHHHHQDPKVME